VIPSICDALPFLKVSLQHKSSILNAIKVSQPSRIVFMTPTAPNTYPMVSSTNYALFPSRGMSLLPFVVVLALEGDQLC